MSKKLLTCFILFIFTLLWSLGIAPAVEEKSRAGVEVKNNDLIYHKFWNLYNGGFVSETGLPGLKKAEGDAAKWNATMKLNTLKVVKEYLGKELYFITETKGAKTARLAPSFYVLKSQQEYLIWWENEKKSPAEITRKHISFFANKDGQIIGSIYLPTLDAAYFYAQLADQTGKPFLVTAKTPVTPEDIKNGLRTDWQHDIPGYYKISENNTFEGSTGTIVFTRFYIGHKKPQPILDATRDVWLKKLTPAEQTVLNNEFDLDLSKFNTNILAENEYFISTGAVKRINDYYQSNKNDFYSQKYFQNKNFIKSGDTCTDWTVINKDNQTEAFEENFNYIVKNKLDPEVWTIVKIAEITAPEKLQELQGTVRLAAQLEITGMLPGYYPWQTVLIDVVQKDAYGQEIVLNNQVRVPVLNKQQKTNYQGVFENEFIISSKTRAIEVFLKIAGTPAADKTKKGAVLDSLAIDKVSLVKTAAVFDIAKLFDSLPVNCLEQKQLHNKPFVVFNSTGEGLVAGDRSFKITNNNRRFQIEYQLANYDNYSGFYSNIFDISEIDELEIAADMQGTLEAKGNPPEWASNTIEIVYFDQDGNIVYPADYGSEKYPKIFLEPKHQGVQTKKSFFSMPHDRGAKYAQLKMHFIKATDPETGAYDPQNYFTGTSLVKNIIIRSALKPHNDKNFAPFNGSFYKHINGSSLSWTTNGVFIKEDLAGQKREVVFENSNSGGWSSLKNELIVPDNATALRGFINLETSGIEAGLAQWEGFGFFLEADVEDSQGNKFHYSGIPAYQKVGDKLVRFERIPGNQKGLIEYYIPLYHEHLKVKKLIWQLALLGKGKVRLLPLEEGINPSLIKIEFLNTGKQLNNPAFWAQYGLNEAGVNDFTFQKNYELQIADQTNYYDSLEALNDHLAGYLKKKIDIKDELRKLAVNEQKEFYKAKIKAVPSYARVEREFELEADIEHLYVSFKLASIDKEAKYNFRALLLNSAGNTLEIPLLIKTQKNLWQKIPATQDVFDLKAGLNEILIPVVKKSFPAEKIRLILGSNQGEITFSDLQIYFVEKIVPAITNDELDNSYQFTIPQHALRRIFKQEGINSLAFVLLDNKDSGILDNNEMVALKKQRQIVPAMNIDNYPKLTGLDKALRQSIKTATVRPYKSRWYYDDNRTFTPIGFTIVGETFNKWYELRLQEFANKETDLYWTAYLTAAEKQDLKNADSSETYIKLFMRAQAKIWQNGGYNTIRVHQLFASWSDLDETEIERTIMLLKMLQKEYGFLIVFDMLPNPDFTGPFFGKEFGNKKHAADLSKTIDLFKATLVLPEVSNDYVKPAMAKIIKVFNKYDFWPNSISYCNETGFIHGYWIIDKNNPQVHPYFSRLYHFYYGRFRQNVAANPQIKSFITNSSVLIQNHLQSVKIKPLLADIEVIKDLIKKRENIKDRASYVYYNLLRNDVINQYSLYQDELLAIKKGFEPLVIKPASITYYAAVDQQVTVIEDAIASLKQAVALKQKSNAQKLETLLQNAQFKQELTALSKTITAAKMPANYTIPRELNFSYIDTFNKLTEEQQKQAFFTSFLLPVAFAQDINSYLATAAGGKKFSIGLNNDFTKDEFMVLANAYLFVNSASAEMRFNKYTHHPIGGHSMIINPGYGNVFDEDSDIDFNLELFTPLTAAGYQMQLSETNYTFTGDDDAGQGNWTIFDYLQIIAADEHILAFQMGPNNMDKPVITDYFNIGNRPYKINAFGLVSTVALAKSLNADFIKKTDFKYDRFGNKISLNAAKISGLAGSLKPGETIGNEKLNFKYAGKRNYTNFTIIALNLTAKETFIHLYGIERNNRQKNRAANHNLVQAYGIQPIIYENLKGLLTVKLTNASNVKIVGFDPTGEKINVDPNAYTTSNGYLTIDTGKTDKRIISYRVSYQ